MNERDIFIEALDKISPEERRSWLDQACGNNSELRSRVELLLRAHDDADSMLDHPVLGDDSPETICRPTTGVPLQPPEADAEQSEIALDFLEPSGQAGHIGRLGQYQVLEVIGQGGMGVVLRANDPKLNRIVALKVLASHLTANATARKRFLREARAAAAVTHPHVIAIYAVDENNTPPYLVMECVDGQSLQQKIDREGELELKEILRIGSQIAAGLAAAHAHGLIHRDIKPANILLENGVERVKITDFGLARAIDDLSITRTGEVTGTPQYMSPEQASGQGVDYRSDLFSLGCVLYAMCTGRSPFRADSTMAVLRRVCDDVQRPIRKVNEAIPGWLVDIIDRLLAKDRDERFESASEVAQLLGDHLAHLQHPSEVPRPARLRKSPCTRGRQRRAPFFRRRWVITAALVLLVFSTGFGVTEGTGVTKLIPTVIELWTPKGTLVLEVHDPRIEVTVKGNGEELSISGAGVHKLTLQLGEYSLVSSKDGQPIKTELVTISRGGREVVRVTKELPVLSDTKSQWMTPGAPDLAIFPFDAHQALKRQQEWAEHLGVPVEYTNSIGMKFCLIPPGEFLMGSTGGEQARLLERAKGADDDAVIDKIPSEVPQHQVRITQPFYLGKYEVTQSEWEAVMGHNPSQFKAPANPVEQVSWWDIQLFLTKLNVAGAKESTKFVLPTEAQWEYVCRAGTATAYCFGEDTAALGEYGWYRCNSGLRTHPVGEKNANGWGLYDMHGNVWEWCADWGSIGYYARSPLDDPVGPEAGAKRVNRGGSWNYSAMGCRSAIRSACEMSYRYSDVGFRVALIIPENTLARTELKRSPGEDEFVPVADARVEWKVADGGNGHWYQVVPAEDGITWHDANARANSLGGYLATITSREENEFIFQLADNRIYWDRPPSWTTSTLGPWIGGLQAKGGREPDGGWQWVTGEPFDFANWAPSGEPVDFSNWAPPKEPNDGHLRIGDGADRICLIVREPAMRSPMWCDARGDCSDVVSYVIEFDEFGTGNEPPPVAAFPNDQL